MLPDQFPFDLVQLSTLPEAEWRGRAVFHPMEQRGDEAIWKMSDEEFAEYLEDFAADDRHWQSKAAYDVGVVLDWEPDPDFADLGVIRVRFVMDSGCTLRYASTNLWTPKVTR